jgi:RHS repeat-associated protein
VGRLRTLIAPGQDSVLLSYDARGRLVRWAQGSRSLRYRYDLGDPFGRLEQVVDTLGRTVAFTYDSAGRVERQDLPGGRSVSYAYDGNGNLSTLTPPGRPAHGFLHTAVDLVEEYIPPDVGLAEERTRYGYDLDRNLETILRPDGIEVSLGYDGAGRLATVTVPEGVVDLDYDWASRLESIASADGAVTVSYGYDGDLVTSEAWTGAVAGTVGYTYDREFRVKTQSVNGGHGATYVYDDDGLPEQAGALDVTRSAATGQLLGTTLGNVTTTHSYNGYGEPLLVAARSGTDTLWRAVYGRDALGRITGISENVLGTVTVRGYAYSDTGFLSVVSANGVAVERYGYDGNGNRTRFEAPGYGVDGDHDDQDRLIEYGDTRYAYTAAGELAERVVGSDTTRYRYDALGNLLAVRFASGDSVEYLVDGRNRRVARLWNGAVTHRWLYQDQLEPVAEVDAAGSVVARYVYGTRGHVPDYVVKGDSTYRIVSDHLGSVRLVVNVASGWVAQRLDYDGYGRVTLDTNPGFQGFGYAGGLWDGATGLVRFGARDYDASMGRWTSRDPQHPGPHGYGAYLYGVADPMSFLDLDGRDIVVAYYPGTRPFGHVGIGVNTTHTRGFNPITKDLAILTGVPRPGQVLPDNPNERIDYVVIPTTTDQDKRVQELIDLREKYPGYYDLNDRSCVDMVRDILQEVGIETEQTDYPRPFFDDLKERFPPPRGPCPRKKP